MKLRELISAEQPWPWLPYLALYFTPWFFRSPLPFELWATAIGLPIFLFFYFLSYRFIGPGRVLSGAGMAIVGIAIAPIMATSANLLIYAAAAFGMAQPRSLAIKALLVHLLVTIAFTFLLQLPWYFLAAGGFFSLMTGGACIMSAELVAKNEALKASQNEIAGLAAEAERERIARDLHDLLGHSLSVIAVKTDLAAKLAEADPAAAKAEIEDIRQTAREALADIRDAVAGMKQMSLAAEIGLARRALASADIAFDARPALEGLPEDIEKTLAMLVREGITNVVRHARASHCTVHIEKVGNSALLVIEDDGVGDIQVEGNGLRGMRERVAAHGGAIKIQSSGGTRIEASLPVFAGEAA